MPDYDVIVAGGGLAGTVTAQAISHYSGQNARVLVVDRNPGEIPGRKSASGWVCGDACSKEAVDYMGERIGIRWGRPEIEHDVKGVMAFSPDMETSIPFDGAGYMLNRVRLPRIQNERSAKMGVEFQFGVTLSGLIYEDGQVAGVEGADQSGAPFKRTARIVVDAAGVTSVLRSGIRNSDKIERRIDRRDLESTGRYIMDFEPGQRDLAQFDPDYCIIHLDQDIAPGGYGWVFPKGETKVNIGLGVEKSLLGARNGRLGKKDTVASLMEEYLHRNPAIRNPRLSGHPDDAGNNSGVFQVSVRRQNDCMVAGGYMMVGDSAWMPKPIDAGGIGPALIAGTIAGRCAAEALEAGDTTEAGLWKYNTEFVKEYGYKTAGLELFRRLVQQLSNEQISYGMKHFLGSLDVEAISKGEHPDFSGLGRIGMIIRGALNKTVAEGLRYTSSENGWLVSHYAAYPGEPGGFGEWHGQLLERLGAAYGRISSFNN
ncbi:MAG: NAD(P)/FAD-dependent oxidoreductase [Nitrosopumilus sp.]|nr:NAD(P)/FAD-dependent oxidoreductase [Nitrosopumilus sp.]MDA7943607.1 NAD(P)/FAD-dependent oxidoreductase [Nitrosopumilus sp.]MDA7998870.1 NAD(P)/FAD-dependent oxidoreductase [Nitrosopumilus sp.]